MELTDYLGAAIQVGSRIVWTNLNGQLSQGVVEDIYALPARRAWKPIVMRARREDGKPINLHYPDRCVVVS